MQNYDSYTNVTKSIQEVKDTFLEQIEKSRRREFNDWTEEQYKEYEKDLSKKIKHLDNMLKKRNRFKRFKNLSEEDINAISEKIVITISLATILAIGGYLVGRLTCVDNFVKGVLSVEDFKV